MKSFCSESRPLQLSDDRKQFRSGQPDLDYFFQAFAGQNQFKHHIGVTHVAVDETNSILGYITLSAAHLAKEDIESTAPEVRKYPNYPLPVLRLSRLAVDENSKGLRIGEALLKHALIAAIAMKDHFGCVGIIVDAKVDAIAFYVKYGFIECEASGGDLRLSPVMMYLPMKQLLAAIQNASSPASSGSV